MAVITFRGPVTRCAIRADDGSEILADIPSHQATRLAVGTRVSARLPDAPVLIAP